MPKFDIRRAEEIYEQELDFEEQLETQYEEFYKKLNEFDEVWVELSEEESEKINEPFEFFKAL